MQRRVLRSVANAASPRHAHTPEAARCTASASADELLAEVERCYTYYAEQVAGVKDPREFQHLKGTVRELEGDLVWGYHGFTPSKHVQHLRMGFYKGDTFSEEPQMSRDVQPLMQLLTSQSPDVVTVALDPEGSGPDTHYKVLQAVAAAVKCVTEGPTATALKKNLRILGYRNVWFRFHPFDSQVMVPVSFADFAHLNDAFETCFVSQKDAEFPSPEYNGPFSHVAQRNQVEQRKQLGTLLGEDFFIESDNPALRGAVGFVYLREMDVDTFVGCARELHEAVEK